MRTGQTGAALIDLIFTAGLVVVLAGIAIPVIHSTRQRDAARTAARYLANRLHVARLEAVKRNVRVALRFDPEDPQRIGIFADGDGDGVGEGDISRGTDYPLDPDVRMPDMFHDVSIRIAQDVPDPDGGPWLAADSDPVRIGSSHLLSFSPLGSGTSGTIYLASAARQQMAVRVLGATGRTRVLLYDTVGAQWREE